MMIYFAGFIIFFTLYCVFFMKDELDPLYPAFIFGAVWPLVVVVFVACVLLYGGYSIADKIWGRA